MTSRLGLFTACLSMVYFSALAIEPPLLDGKGESTKARLIESFSPYENPGKGKLTFKHAGKTETIEVGASGGHYASGMIFHSSSLPEPMKQDLKNHHVIQISLGNLPGKGEGFPQFGMLSLVSRKIPNGRRVFRTTLPADTASQVEENALVLFSSPSLPKERGDEELLKGTFFGQAGTLTVVPLNRPEAVEILHQGSRLPFRSQNLRVTFNSILMTPFNTQDGDLSGTVDIPVVWPQGKQSELFMKRVAMESMGALPTTVAPASRDVATPKNRYPLPFR